MFQGEFRLSFWEKVVEALNVTSGRLRFITAKYFSKDMSVHLLFLVGLQNAIFSATWLVHSMRI